MKKYFNVLLFSSFVFLLAFFLLNLIYDGTGNALTFKEAEGLKFSLVFSFAATFSYFIFYKRMIPFIEDVSTYGIKTEDVDAEYNKAEKNITHTLFLYHSEIINKPDGNEVKIIPESNWKELINKITEIKSK